MRFLKTLAFAVVLSACGGQEDDATTKVTLLLSTTGALSPGDGIAVTAVLPNHQGEFVPAPPMQWTSRDPGVATVEGRGTDAAIHAVGRGTTVVTATNDGFVGSVSITVQ